MKPIKIDKQVNVTSTSYKNLLKKDRKEAYGTTKESFVNTTVYLTWEQGDKLDKFIEYCKQFLCAICMKKVPADSFKSNDNNELILVCPQCGAETIDSYKESIDYVKWFNDVLKDYGMSFNTGFPKLMTSKKAYKDSMSKSRTWTADNPGF